MEKRREKGKWSKEPEWKIYQHAASFVFDKKLRGLVFMNIYAQKGLLAKRAYTKQVADLARERGETRSQLAEYVERLLDVMKFIMDELQLMKLICKQQDRLISNKDIAINSQKLYRQIVSVFGSYAKDPELVGPSWEKYKKKGPGPKENVEKAWNTAMKFMTGKFKDTGLSTRDAGLLYKRYRPLVVINLAFFAYFILSPQHLPEKSPFTLKNLMTN